MAYSDTMWAEAKKKCRLKEADITLAKRLGLNPRSLIKNIPNKSEQRKPPVKNWLHELEATCRKKAAQKQRRYEYGAIDPCTGESRFLILSYCNTACMNIFLKTLSEHYPATSCFCAATALPGIRPAHCLSLKIYGCFLPLS